MDVRGHVEENAGHVFFVRMRDCQVHFPRPSYLSPFAEETAVVDAESHEPTVEAVIQLNQMSLDGTVITQVCVFVPKSCTHSPRCSLL